MDRKYSTLLLLVLPHLAKSIPPNEFSSCDADIPISGTSYLESPFYPDDYPASTSCRYVITAPLDYVVVAQCDLSMPCNWNSFFVNRDGDKLLTEYQLYCDIGSLNEVSSFGRLILAYVSNGGRGNFKCKLTVRKERYTCGWSTKSTIANGDFANENEYPSAVALTFRANTRSAFCGATIISHRYIVTAAHCTNYAGDPRNVVAVVGSVDISNTDAPFSANYDIVKIIEHPNYIDNDERVENDIALLLTAIDIEWSQAVGPICLPKEWQTFVDEPVDVVGWGTIGVAGPTSPTLQKVVLTVLTTANCAAIYRGYQQIIDSHVCTSDLSDRNRDSCQFDSGGPVIRALESQTFVGIISSGMPCGIGPHPTDVNTRITSYLPWIREEAGDV